MKIEKYFFSYEGEGENIGLKTLFITISEKNNLEINLIKEIDKVSHLYINLNKDIKNDFYLKKELYFLILKFDLVTIEISNKFFDIELLEFSKLIFYRLDEDIYKVNLPKEISIKIEILNKNEIEKKIEFANYYGELNYKVYLMPCYYNNVGEDMMKYFDILNKNVRFMPPTQFLININ